MKTQRLTLALTAINFALLASNLVGLRARPAQAVSPVLRGRSLEIVDEQGRRRAQILVTTPVVVDGKRYPETTLLRLIDPNGRPVVKIGASTEGSGLMLSGDSERREWSGVQILAEGAGNTVRLRNKNGREKQIQP